MSSAPLALGLVPQGSGSGCHCRGWARVGTGRRAAELGQGTAGLWVCVHPWRGSLRTEIGSLNSLSCLMPREEKLPTLFSYLLLLEYLLLS